MNQTSISTIVDDDLDEAPELTEADLARAIYKVAGTVVSKEEWQKAKVLRESGKSLSEVELLTGINKSSIQRKEKKEKEKKKNAQIIKANLRWTQMN